VSRASYHRVSLQLLWPVIPTAILKNQGSATIGQHLNPFRTQVLVLLAVGHEDAEAFGVPLNRVLFAIQRTAIEYSTIRQFATRR
jgi:hypothetical protein